MASLLTVILFCCFIDIQSSMCTSVPGPVPSDSPVRPPGITHGSGNVPPDPPGPPGTPGRYPPGSHPVPPGPKIPSAPPALKGIPTHSNILPLQVTTTEDPRTAGLARPDIRSLHIVTDIQLRYAKTLVSSSLANPANESQEVFFTVVLPEKAFISKFTIEIDDEVYEAYVKEKVEARREYEAAVSAGMTAGHVAVSTRDSNTYTTSVNIQAEGKVKFKLTYEELLIRTRGRYEHIVNINPGQLVRDLRVEVNIRESRNISFLKVPMLRTDGIVKQNETENIIAVIERPSPTETYISYKPSIKQQKKSSKRGLHGQFVVQYDVERELDAGDVLVVNGHFVHFFAPVDLQPIPKHIVFVLDTSGSMYGNKIVQTKEAMTTILGDLNPEDMFNIVQFSDRIRHWNTIPEGEANMTTTEPSTKGTQTPGYYRYGYDYDKEFTVDEEWQAYPVNDYYIQQAKKYVQSLYAQGSTDINKALLVALKISLAVRGDHRNLEPLIVFLTDGEPTIGVTDLDVIKRNVIKSNREAETAIFCLAFGTGADFNFLKQVSLQNNAFARKIYEASDATLQLEGFYEEISNPLLSNVTITYAEDILEEDSLTDNKFRTYFKGSELVVAGKTTEDEVPDFKSEVTASSVEGGFRRHDIVICPPFIPGPVPTLPTVPSLPLPPTEPPRNVTYLENFVERMWAYLTIKELLREAEAAAEDVTPTPKPTEPPTDVVFNDTVSNDTATVVVNETYVNITYEDMLQPSELSPKEQALQLSLKYGFVTPLTSLVVVKPNDTSTTDTKPIDEFEDGVNQVASHQLPPPSVHVSAPGFDYDYSYGLSLPAPQGVPGQRGPPGSTGIAPRPSPHGPVHNFSLSDLSWFGSMVNETTIALPLTLDPSGYMKISTTMPDVAFQECQTTSGEEGECRHLTYCILPYFLSEYSIYLEYYCAIRGGYAGVCCPLD